MGVNRLSLMRILYLVGREGQAKYILKPLSISVKLSHNSLCVLSSKAI